MLLQLNHTDVIIIHNSKNAVTFKLFFWGEGGKAAFNVISED